VAAGQPTEQEAWLERIRRTGLRLDRDGTWWHEGEPVRHERMAHAFHSWIDQLPTGRWVLRLDADRYAYFDLDDTPYVARSARREGDSFWLLLSNGQEERLDPATLRRRGNDLLCQARDGRFPCRLLAPAVAVLAPAIHEIDGRPQLEIAGRRYAL
jgi:hypothetical protein